MFDSQWHRRSFLSFLFALFLMGLTLSLPAYCQEETALGIGLEGYAYPYPIHFLPLQIEGQDLRMAYMDVPPSGPANGQTVLLLHGKNMGGYYWKDMIGWLTQTGYRVVVPDQIGWGKSSKPDIPYRFDTLAANTAHLLDTLGISKVSVIGHSTGGMLAVRFARTYPNRVTHLILEDPIGLEDYRRKIPPQTDETLYQAELANTDPTKIKAFFAHYFAKPHPELSDPLADVFIRVAGSGEWPRWARASARAYQMIYEQPVRSEYDLLTMPTLIIVGQEDHTVIMANYAPPDVVQTMGHFPDLARAAAKDIPHGEAVIIPDCGHIPHLEQPERFRTEVMRFLSTPNG